jgi:hypothetical protein
MYAAARLADQLTEAVLEMEAAIDGAAAKLLAVRRAALTALYEAQECANDSLGELGRAASEALASYVSSPWRDSGVDAKEAQAVTAYAQVAADAVDRFVSTAEGLGSARWQPLDAMVRHACARHRVDIARDLLDAADVPGFHQNWVRERRTSLAGDAP